MDDPAAIRSFDEYESIVDERLTDLGYDRLDDAPDGYDAVAYHRRSGSVLPPGSLELVVVVARLASPGVRTVQTFSERAFSFGCEHPTTRSRSLGGVPSVLAVAACEDPDPEIKRWVADYHASHVRAYEFPVVVDLPAETVHYYGDTPLLGRRAHERFRHTAAETLDPSRADPDLESL
jgi:hypothetical protein